MLASMRAQGSSSRRLICGTISTPPGTGSSPGQSVVKPRCTSTTRSAPSDGRMGWTVFMGSLRACGYNTPIRADQGAAMALQIRKIQVWSGEIPDRPGAAAASLERLARAGADLEFVFTRPNPKKPDTMVIFLAPITGTEQTQAARASGLAPALDVAMLSVEGTNRAGIGYDIMSHLAVASINL